MKHPPKDYYDVLGVPKDADTAAIKKAYRSKARSTHPDAGGDADAFALVSAAYDTLSDASRRAYYDKHGKAPEGISVEQKAQAILRTSLNAILFTKDMQSVKYKDLAGEISGAMQQAMLSVKTKIAMMDERVLIAEEMRDRFGSKDGEPDLVAQLVDQQISAIKSDRANAEDEIAVLDLAMNIWKDYTYRVDQMDVKAMQAMYGQDGTLLGQSGFLRVLMNGGSPL